MLHNLALALPILRETGADEKPIIDTIFTQIGVGPQDRVLHLLTLCDNGMNNKPDYRAAIATFEVLFITHYEDACSLLEPLEAALRGEPSRGGWNVFNLYPVVIVAILLAAVKCEDASEVENPEFQKDLPHAVGRMLRRFGDTSRTSVNNKVDDWVVSQFLSAVNGYLNSKDNPGWSTRAEAMLAPLGGLLVVGTGCEKFFSQLTHRALSSLPFGRQHKMLHAELESINLI